MATETTHNMTSKVTAVTVRRMSLTQGRAITVYASLATCNKATKNYLVCDVIS